MVDDHGSNPALRFEHGLSLLIEHGGRKVLFDTGQTGLVVENGGILGLGLEDVSAIVLSHGHYDHCGGLENLLRNAAADPTVYAHPDVLTEKFSCTPGALPRDIGIPDRRLLSACLHLSSAPVEIFPGLVFLGEIPRQNSFEDTGGPFFLDSEGKVPDPLLDDTGLLMETDTGMVLFCGCAHSGLVNIVTYAAALYGIQRFRAVIGGFHLHNAHPFRLKKTLAAMASYHVEQAAPLHCTGERAVRAFHDHFGGDCLHCGAGSRLIF